MYLIIGFAIIGLTVVGMLIPPDACYEIWPHRRRLNKSYDENGDEDEPSLMGDRSDAAVPRRSCPGRRRARQPPHIRRAAE